MAVVSTFFGAAPRRPEPPAQTSPFMPDPFGVRVVVTGNRFHNAMPPWQQQQGAAGAMGLQGVSGLSELFDSIQQQNGYAVEITYSTAPASNTTFVDGMMEWVRKITG